MELTSIFGYVCSLSSPDSSNLGPFRSTMHHLQDTSYFLSGKFLIFFGLRGYSWLYTVILEVGKCLDLVWMSVLYSYIFIKKQVLYNLINIYSSIYLLHSQIAPEKSSVQTQKKH